MAHSVKRRPHTAVTKMVVGFLLLHLAAVQPGIFITGSITVCVSWTYWYRVAIYSLIYRFDSLELKYVIF